METAAPLAALLGWAALKGTLLLVFAGAASVILRGARAAVRHAVWAGALGAALVLPALDALGPAWRLAILPAVPVSVESAGAGMSEGSVAWAPALVVAVWALGVLVVGLRWAAGAWNARALVRLSAPFADPEWRAEAARVGRVLGLRRPVELRVSRDLRSPVAWGVRRPVLLLPEAAAGWTAERRAAVLAHELAHVRRRDCATGFVAQAACALHWFNPLAWLAYRRLLVERERACDDGVLRGGLLASRYAAHLLDVAREATAPRARLLAAPGFAGRGRAALVRRTEIEERIRAMLDGRPRRGPLPTAAVALLGSVALAAAAVLGAVEPVHRALPPAPPIVAQAVVEPVPAAPSEPVAAVPIAPVAERRPERAPAVRREASARERRPLAAAPVVPAAHAEAPALAVADDPKRAPETLDEAPAGKPAAFALAGAAGLRAGMPAPAYRAVTLTWRAPSGPMASEEPRRLVRVVRVAARPRGGLRRVVAPPLPAGLWGERADEARAALERVALAELPMAPEAWAALGVRPEGRRVRERVHRERNTSTQTRTEKEVRVDSSGSGSYRPGRAAVAPGGSCEGAGGAAAPSSTAPTIW